MEKAEEVRKSVLDVITETLQKQGKSQLLDRMVYVAKLTEQASNRKDVGTYFESFFTKFHSDLGLQEYASGNRVTGILLVLQQTCIHLMEGSSKVIKAHIRELHATPKAKRIIDDVKIIASTEDIPARKFPLWVSRVLNIGRTTSPSDPPPEIEDIEPQVSECYLNLLQLGKSLAEQDPSVLEETLEGLRSKYKEQLPSNELLQAFIQSDDAFEIGEWLEVFDSPVDIALEKDLIWPTPP